MFKNKEIERELWKNKYIRHQPTHEIKNDQEQYRSFLDRQVKQQN